MPARKANARWEGGVPDGNGTVALGSGAFEGAYSFKSRFEDGTGTNPEELIAGAHASCFSMALSLGLTQAGNPPESIATEATVHIVKDGEGFTINKIELVTRGSVPGIDAAAFEEAAQAAKAGCPVSKVLTGAEITLDAQLEG
jgi:osmotically inducible protein OsmC